MKIAQKNFWFAVVGGLILGGAFTLSAFAEPTAVPASTTSYPPINVGPETQYRIGKLGTGDGSSTLPSQSLVDPNTFYVQGVYGTESLSIKQNATLVGNVQIGARAIIAGVLRVAQLVVDEPMSGEKNNANVRNYPGYAQGYGLNSEKLYFAIGSDTNIGRGNTCTVSSGTSCPLGTMLFKINGNTTTCRYINPSVNPSSPSNLGSCSSYPSISITLTNASQNSNNCQATKTYTSNASGTTYWQIKGINDTEWTNHGTGSTKNVVVAMGASSADVYNLRAYTVVNGVPVSALENVSAVYSSACIAQGGGSGGSTGL